MKPKDGDQDAPAETGTPTPETYAEYNRIAESVAFGDQLKAMADFALRLELERDEARKQLAAVTRENVQIEAAIIQHCPQFDADGAGSCGDRLSVAVRALRQQLADVMREREQYQRILLQSDNDKGALRHSLAAAEALLEKRTKALEDCAKLLADLKRIALWDNVPDLDNAKAALALTPEQALAEKEGIDKPKHD